MDDVSEAAENSHGVPPCRIFVAAFAAHKAGTVPGNNRQYFGLMPLAPQTSLAAFAIFWHFSPHKR
ncbi:hypothetical protein NY78_0788 [Desulfovibrio sp. TomC]|nr:hypothetical protein NY78_0788 [Desulfovibrio sp. TomC]